MSAFRAATLRGKQPFARVDARRGRTGSLAPRNWMQPEVVAKIADSTTPFVVSANESSIAPPRMSLQELVDNYVATRRADYISQAWSAFADGRYQDARNKLLLANSASAQDPKSRPYIQLALVYVGIATQEYWQAGASLVWLLGESPHAPPPDPEVFNQIPDIRTLYRARSGRDCSAHLQNMENFAVQNPESATARALWAVALWGSGDRANAIFQAGRITPNASDAAVFSQLADVLKQANDPTRSPKEGDIMDLLLPDAASGKSAR